MKKVVISLLHYNNEEATNTCLKSLLHIDTKSIDVSVIVRDNGSRVPYILPQDILPKTQLIRSDSNDGFSGGQNKNIQKAITEHADYILVLNNDTVVDTSFLVSLVESFEQHPHAGIITPKIYYAAGSEYHKTRYKKDEVGKVLWYTGGSIDWKNIFGKHRGVDEVDTGLYNVAEMVTFATGCCMLIKKDVIEKVGLFDERYFLYYEDADFCERVKQAGFTLWYEPKAIIWHQNAEASGGSGSALQEYYVSRNRMLFGFSYGSLRTKFALFRESIRLLLQGRKWQKIAIRDYYLGKYGKGSYA